MIDMLVLRCTSKRVPVGFGVKLERLGIPLEISIDKHGQVLGTRHSWERVPSSYDFMAFKVFDFSLDGSETFFIEIKASPAKLMLGHNVYGSSDFFDCCMTLINLLRGAYPQLFDYLDHDTWSLSQIDITYSSRAKDNKEAKAFINALQNVSRGHTKSRTGYDGTAYFGKKNSRLKKLKAYHKLSELNYQRKKLKSDSHLLEVYSDSLLAFSDGLIRWESSLYHRYLERRGISTKLLDLFFNNSLSIEKLQSFWELAWDDIFKALSGHSITVFNDDELKEALRAKFTKTSVKTGRTSTAFPDSVFRTYLNIKANGYETIKSEMPRNTFSVHLKALSDCGICRASLQNLGASKVSENISFEKFIKIDFDNQFPADYVEPSPKYVYSPDFSFNGFFQCS